MDKQRRVGFVAAAAVLLGLGLAASPADAIWPRGFGGPLADKAHASVVDASGNTYFTGEFAGTFFIDGTEISSQGLSDIFVVKVNALGDALWVATAGGSSVDRGEVIAVDAAGRIYVAGVFSGTAVFNNEMSSSLELPACPGGPPSCGREDAFGEIFVAQLTPDGEWAWVRQFGSGPDLADRALALDVAPGDGSLTPPAPDGILLAFSSPCPEFRAEDGSLNSVPGGSFGTCSPPTERWDLVKFDNSGNPVWGLPGGTGTVTDLEVMPGQDEVLLTGSFTGDVNLGPAGDQVSLSWDVPSTDPRYFLSFWRKNKYSVSPFVTPTDWNGNDCQSYGLQVGARDSEGTFYNLEYIPFAGNIPDWEEVTLEVPPDFVGNDVKFEFHVYAPTAGTFCDYLSEFTIDDLELRSDTGEILWSEEFPTLTTPAGWSFSGTNDSAGVTLPGHSSSYSLEISRRTAAELSTFVPAAIPDGGAVHSYINMPSNLPVVDYLYFRYENVHSSPSDLILKLRSPGNIGDVEWIINGCNGVVTIHCLSGYYFVDSYFDGAASNVQWTFRLEDDSLNGHVGSVTKWALEINRADDRSIYSPTIPIPDTRGPNSFMARVNDANSVNRRFGWAQPLPADLASSDLALDGSTLYLAGFANGNDKTDFPGPPYYLSGYQAFLAKADASASQSGPVWEWALEQYSPDGGRMFIDDLALSRETESSDRAVFLAGTEVTTEEVLEAPDTTIADNGVTTLTKKILRKGTVDEVDDVFFSLSHVAREELRVELESPDGTTVTLIDETSPPGPGDAFFYSPPDTPANGSLADFEGKSIEGDWSLKVYDNDQGAEISDYSITTVLDDIAPPAGAYTGLLTGRRNNNLEASQCGSGRSDPGFFTFVGERRYDGRGFYNSSCQTECVSVRLTADANLWSYAVGLGDTWLGDLGMFYGGTATYSFEVDCLETFYVNVLELEPGGGVGTSYQLDVSRTGFVNDWGFSLRANERGDVVVRKVGADGVDEWEAQTFGTDVSVEGLGTALLNPVGSGPEKIFVAGTFDGSSVFGPTPPPENTTTLLESNGETDAYVTRLDGETGEWFDARVRDYLVGQAIVPATNAYLLDAVVSRPDIILQDGGNPNDHFLWVTTPVPKLFAIWPTQAEIRWKVDPDVTSEARAESQFVDVQFPGGFCDQPETFGSGSASGSYTDPAIPIPDADSNGIQSVIEIDTGGLVKDIEVSLDISHTYIGDLVIDLQSPNGTVVRLHDQTGDTTDNLVTMYPVLTTPHGDLSAFAGGPVKGRWTLLVYDLLSQDLGQLNSWSLEIDATPEPCRQAHIAGSPTEIDPAADGNHFTFQRVHTVEGPIHGSDSGLEASGDAAAPDLQIFNATEPGMSLLIYANDSSQADINLNGPLFEIVQTYAYNDFVTGRFDPDGVTELTASSGACDIGQEITSAAHTQPERPGYVLFERAYYDGSGPSALYDRASRSGRIFPVNVHDVLTSNGAPMAVSWYQENRGPRPAGETCGGGLYPERSGDDCAIAPHGIYWPVVAADYACDWPTSPPKIVIASQTGSELCEWEAPMPPASPSPPTCPAGTPSGKGSVLFDEVFVDMQIYDQPNPALPGFNPNDEHALFALSNQGSGRNALFALRSDFGDELSDASRPFVLLKYRNSHDSLAWTFQVFKVRAFSAEYPDLRFPALAGDSIGAPYPLRVLPACPQVSNEKSPGICDEIATSEVAGTCSTEDSEAYYFQDYKGGSWAKAAADPGEAGCTPSPPGEPNDPECPSQAIQDGEIITRFYYPLQQGFYFLDRRESPMVGQCVPWMDELDAAAADVFDPASVTLPGVPINVVYDVAWPLDAPSLAPGETLLEPKRGLPDIYNQAAVEILFDQADPLLKDPDDFLAQIIDPLSPRVLRHCDTPGLKVSAPCHTLEALPADVATADNGTRLVSRTDGTGKLTFDLRQRLSWSTADKELSFEGIFDDSEAGDPLLLLNVMTDRERGRLKALSTDSDFDTAIDELFYLTRNPQAIDIDGIPGIDRPKEPNDPLLMGLQDELGGADGSGGPTRDGKPESLRAVGFKPALTAGYSRNTGYMTLVLNNDEALDPLPVSLSVIKVDCVSPAVSGSYPGPPSAPPLPIPDNDPAGVRSTIGIEFAGTETVQSVSVTVDIEHLPSVAPLTVKLEAPSGALATVRGPGGTEPTLTAFYPDVGLAGEAIDGDWTLIVTDTDGNPHAGFLNRWSLVIEYGTESPYIGVIKQVQAESVFDEQLTLRHVGDFGGYADRLDFRWWVHPAEGGVPPDYLPGDFPADPGPPAGWTLLNAGEERGAIDLVIEGANAQTLSDNYFFVDYQGLPICGNDSDPSTVAGDPGATPAAPRAKLGEGWVKRVIKGLNPYETRVKDFHKSPTETFTSALISLGERYEGDIALNPDPDAINNVGLIEAYETVLRRAMALSIDSSPPFNLGPVNDALLLITSRLSDFYTLLGNEAFADASDPMIGFGTASGIYGSLAPAIFAFQNQLASQLDEEVTLLRGRDDSSAGVVAPPVYNRLLWNFTTGDGEVAYQQTYNISDQPDACPAGLPNHPSCGVIDEFDARFMYPQGHGDAWGHYLMSLKMYYRLLRHPSYSWLARAEAINVAGQGVQVDFFDERKFAQAAAAKARTGAQLVDMTYRQYFVDNPNGQWQGYKDPEPERAWGLSEWGRRAGQGAYFDWVVGNAILPDEDTDPSHQGIAKVDRSTVRELDEVRSHFVDIQGRVDQADQGLNPLGLAKGVVPFDIDPALVADRSATHFEQVYDRALTALGNAVAAFDHANQLTELLRRSQDTAEEFTENATDQERDFNHRLKEIFGAPYSGDIGLPPKAYPAGYDGPDILHHMWVEQTDLTGTPDCPVTMIEAEYQAHPPCATDDPPESCSLADTDSEPIRASYAACHRSRSTAFPGLVKPPEITGSRLVTGDAQDKLSDVLRAINSHEQALVAYDLHVGKVEDQLWLLRAEHALSEELLEIKNDASNTRQSLQKRMTVLRGAAIAARGAGRKVKKLAKASRACIPRSMIFGFSNGGDTFAPARCALAASAVAAEVISAAVAINAESSRLSAAAAKKELQYTTALKIETAEANFEAQEQMKVLEALMREEPLMRLELNDRQEVIQQSLRAYGRTLAEGLRIAEQRVTFRTRAATDVQEARYQDMAFRIFRNDALQKYQAAFDLAARYVYLAATAYDYETNLLGSDGNSGQEFLTDIVRERSLGQVQPDGTPVPGRGLADVLARLDANFGVLKGQLGFNNPQRETIRFSLREEHFRRMAEDDGVDLDWRRLLTTNRVDNLWEVPEFRRFARPFADESAGPQPGLVIPFDTTITFGQNFFGWPLGPGDSSYDPTNFATRVHSVGVWFEDYDQLPLSSTPRVYLIPVGVDVLRSPTADDFSTREWQVIDQKLPVPFPISSEDLANPDWIPRFDTVVGGFNEIRKFSSFRAYEFAEPFSDAEVSPDSRLIGRSVWNRKWLLIIPGGTLLADPVEGLETLIDGVEQAGGVRDGRGVSDIKILFQTYGYSGN